MGRVIILQIAPPGSTAAYFKRSGFTRRARFWAFLKSRGVKFGEFLLYWLVTESSILSYSVTNTKILSLRSRASSSAHGLKDFVLPLRSDILPGDHSSDYAGRAYLHLCGCVERAMWPFPSSGGLLV